MNQEREMKVGKANRLGQVVISRMLLLLHRLCSGLLWTGRRSRIVRLLFRTRDDVINAQQQDGGLEFMTKINW